jgi:hypothetical protein
LFVRSILEIVEWISIDLLDRSIDNITELLDPVSRSLLSIVVDDTDVKEVSCRSPESLERIEECVMSRLDDPVVLRREDIKDILVTLTYIPTTYSTEDVMLVLCRV